MLTTSSGRPGTGPATLSFSRRSKKQVDAKGFTLMTLPYLQELAVEQKGYRTPQLNDNLYLHYKGFAHISDAISNYAGLKSLWLEGNALSALDHLHTLPNLRCLYLQENCFESIPATPTSQLAQLQELRILNLSNNILTSLPAELALLPHLSSLHVSNNKLGPNPDSIAVLKDCAALSVLDLHHNTLTSPECITAILWSMPALAVLTCHHNPVLQTMTQYRRNTIAHVRTLTYLDDRPVSDNERLATEAWAKGGLEAEREEQQRQRDEEKSEQRRNFEALARLQAENREKRRERGDVWDDAVPSMGFAGEGLKKMYEDMVDKGLAGGEEQGASLSSSDEEEQDEVDDEVENVPELEAATADEGQVVQEASAPPAVEPPALSFAANRAPPVRANRAMDVAGTLLDALPASVQAHNGPAVSITSRSKVLIQEVDDDSEHEEEEATASFTPLAELLADDDNNNKNIKEDEPVKSGIESLVTISPSNKDQEQVDDEPLRPLIATNSQPTRRAWIEELPDEPRPAANEPVQTQDELVEDSDDDGEQDLGTDPYKIRAFRRSQQKQQDQLPDVAREPAHSPRNVETDIADVTLAAAPLPLDEQEQREPIDLPAASTSISSTSTSSMPTPMLSPECPPAPVSTPALAGSSGADDMCEPVTAIHIPRAIRAGIPTSSSSHKHAPPNLRISLPPAHTAFHAPPKCPSTPTPMASGTLAPPGTPAGSAASTPSSEALVGHVWESAPRAPHSTPVCESFPASAFTGVTASSVWSELGGGGSPLEAAGTRAPHSTPVSETFSPLSLGPMAGPPTPTRRQSSSRLLRKVLGSPVLTPSSTDAWSSSSSGMSSPLAMTLDPEEVGDDDADAGSVVAQAGSSGRRSTASSSVSSASTYVQGDDEADAVIVLPQRVATPVLDQGDHGRPAPAPVHAPMALAMPKPDRNRKGLRLIPNLAAAAAGPLSAAATAGAGAIAPPSTPVPITPTRVMAMQFSAPDTPMSAGMPRAPMSTPVAGVRVAGRVRESVVEPRVAVEAARRVFNARAMMSEEEEGKEDVVAVAEEVEQEEEMPVRAATGLVQIADDLEWDESGDEEEDESESAAYVPGMVNGNGYVDEEEEDEESVEEFEQEIEEQVHQELVEQVRMVEVVGPSFALGGDGEESAKADQVGDKDREEQDQSKDMREIGLAWGEEAQV